MKSLPEKTGVTEHGMIKDCAQRLLREHPYKPPSVPDERELKEASPLPEVTQLIEPALALGPTFSESIYSKIMPEKIGVSFSSSTGVTSAFPGYTVLLSGLEMVKSLEPLAL